jgi:tripartite ATP-independent transporter DctP family solute receptor
MTKMILGAMALMLTTATAFAEVQDRIVRFGYGLNEDSNQGRAVQFFADEVARLSDGKIKVKGFGAAALGSDVQMQAALAGGAQEMMVGSTATLVGTATAFAAWDIPFLFANEAEADAVLDGPAGQMVIDTLPEHGLVGLVYWENGFRNLTNNVRPIVTAEDLTGIKLRVMQNQVYLDTFLAAGANAVPMPFSELFTALETGAVDGQENPFGTILSSKFYEVQKYLTITNHVYSPWIVLVSKSWWDSLSADEQKILMDAAIASRAFEREDTRKASAAALEDLKAKGMEVTVMAPEEVQKLRDIAAPISQTVIDGLDKTLWETVQAELAKARTQ